MIDSPYLWCDRTAGKYCVLDGLHSVPDSHEIQFGISRATGFPHDAHYCMDPEFKKQVALSDNLWGPGGDRVISAKLKDFLAARNPIDVEFLPVSIINHKGKVASADYSILHPLRIVDCIDQKNSAFKWNAIKPDLIGSCSKLVLNLAAIPENLLFWRPRHLEHDVFVQRNLADEIVAAGFTGVRFKEVPDYGG